MKKILSTTLGLLLSLGAMSQSTYPIGPNLAAGKPAQASSSERAGTLPKFAVDNNFSTRWASAYVNQTPAAASTQWIYVDLGATYPITKVRVNWQAAYAKDYQIQVSPDGIAWAPAPTTSGQTATVTGNTAQINLISGISASTRFVRVYCTARGTGYGYSIYELEVSSSNTAPNVVLTQPAANSTYTGPIQLSANASDPDGAVSKVAFYVDDVLVGTDLTSPYEVTWTNPTNGTHVAKAIATDDNGATTTAYKREFYVDNVSSNAPPSVVLTQPAANSTYAGPVELTADASDSDGTVAQVAFYVDNVLVGVDASSPYAVTWATTSTSTHVAKAVATDNAGATTASVTREFYTNNTSNNALPTVQLNSPINDGRYPKGRAVFFQADATDPDGTIGKVEFFRENLGAGRVLLGAGTLSAGSSYFFDWKGAPTGTYRVWARATDNTGAFADTPPITINVTNTPPTVGLTSPQAADYPKGSQITITADAADPDGGVTQVAFYADSTLLNIDTTSPYSYVWTAAMPGVYNITAVATDNEGATATSIARRVQVLQDRPVVTVKSPVANATYPSQQPVVIAADVSSADGKIAKVEFYQNGFRPVLLASFTTGPYTYSWNNVAPGTYSVTVRATDNLGFTTSVSQAFTVVDAANKTVPGKIEAEGYDAMLDVATEPTADTGGGLNVGYLDAGNWMDYQVTTAANAYYTVQFRVASWMNGTQLQLRRNDGLEGMAVLTTVDLPNTGGGQNWQTVTVNNVLLGVGAQTLRVYAVTGGFNFNWMSFALAGARGTLAAGPAGQPAARVAAYPNPSQGLFSVTGAPEGTVATLVTPTGQLVGTRVVHNGTVDARALPAGVYFLSLKSESKVVKLRLIKE